MNIGSCAYLHTRFPLTEYTPVTLFAGNPQFFVTFMWQMKRLHTHSSFIIPQILTLTSRTSVIVRLQVNFPFT